MSHEIRTPINAIVGLAHLLRNDRPTPGQADRLSKIVAAAEHLLYIVDDILDHSRMDGDNSSPEASKPSITAILDNVRSVLFEQARAAPRPEADDAPATAHPSPSHAMDERDVESMLRSKCRGARLLLVEDNPVNRGVALDLLLAAGIVADTAENGLEAVEKAAQTNYDLILMDVQLPIMNGLEATRVIRLQRGGTEMPILAMTANAFEDARLACLEAGMNDFVAKPINLHDFYACLLTWLPAVMRQAGPPCHAVAPQPDAENGQLACIPGLDSECGLATMRGNVGQYTAVLKLFADECHRQSVDLSKILSRLEFAAIEPVACSMRGTAAMLGARKVAAAAGEVMRACRNDADAIGLACGVLIKELSLCAEAIRGVVTEAVETVDPEIDPGQLADILAQLLPLLEYGDIEAGHLARENAGLLQAAFGKRAGRLLARIEAFDYEGAVAELRPILADLNGTTDGLSNSSAA